MRQSLYNTLHLYNQLRSSYDFVPSAGGHNIKRIQEATGARVQVEQRRPMAGYPSSVVVSGTKEGVAKALEIVQECLAKIPAPPGPTRTPSGGTLPPLPLGSPMASSQSPEGPPVFNAAHMNSAVSGQYGSPYGPGVPPSVMPYNSYATTQYTNSYYSQPHMHNLHNDSPTTPLSSYYRKPISLPPGWIAGTGMRLRLHCHLPWAAHVN